MIKKTYSTRPSPTSLCLLSLRIFLTFCIFVAGFMHTGCSSLTTKTAAATISASLSWPSYDDVEADAYIAACRQAWVRGQRSLRELEKQALRAPETILVGINELEVLVNEPAGRAGLYANVHPNKSMRAAGDFCEQQFMALASDIHLSRPLYEKVLQIDFTQLTDDERYFAQHTQQKFELAGVGLGADKRERVRQLNADIVKLGQEFLSNIRNDKRIVELTEADLNGLPQDYVTQHPADGHGVVRLSTDYPDYFPFMQYAHSDDAKRKMYVVFRQRGYPSNKVVLQQLLSARHELATLLGFNNFADYITADKMIGSAETAAEFIDQITKIAAPKAAQDYAVLLQRLRQINPGAQVVNDWQKTYLENLIRSEVYAVDQQEVRQYFSYQQVKNGVFNLLEELFGISIVPWNTEVWHPSVEAYEILENGQLLGQFYLDMHPREGKYKHAAHFGIRDGAQGMQTPLAALVCNFPGADGGADFLEHDQVETFLHEFGHLLHTIFGGHQPWVGLAGTNTQRDFVEAPSQMLEEWVWDAQALQTIARNEQGESIPPTLVARMNQARNFARGTFVQHQMFYAALSLNYYQQNPSTLNLDQLMVDLQAQYSPFPYVEDTYFYTSFGHLNGYSALYYTYMWSQVIAADLFSEFKKYGLHNKSLATRYRNTILAPGASQPAAVLVERFLGRPFNFEAFAASLSGEKAL